MQINNLKNNLAGQVNGASYNSTEGVSSTSKVSKTNGTTSDQVSINSFGTAKNDALFAKIELEKVNKESFGRLKEMHSKIQAYNAAAEESPEAASNTELGKMLNDPKVMGSIAQSMAD